jgi:hypothetical protein
MLLAVKFFLSVWLAIGIGFCFWLIVAATFTLWSERSFKRDDLGLFMTLITIASLGIVTVGWMWG